jgi:hypothetical protein
VTADQLYALLPAVHRIRDDGSLRALVDVLAMQAETLSENIEQLYDDLFIETCAEWAVPYIGDLVGARLLFGAETTGVSNRAQVANTLAYRRRKGTASVLEQLARDVTGWDASAVEYFQRLAVTQYMNHPRPGNLATIGIRRASPVAPFDLRPRNADVRGPYNIPHVGIFLFRVQSFSRTVATAAAFSPRRFFFHPLAQNVRLYNLPEPEDAISQLAAAVNVPLPLERQEVARDLARYYGPGRAFHLVVNGVPAPIADIRICNLEDVPGDWAHAPLNAIAVDPVLGRIYFPSAQPSPTSVEVSFHYGFTARMGGGEYSRVATFTPGVAAVNVPDDEPDLHAALTSVAAGGAVQLNSNQALRGAFAIDAAAGAQVELRAADGRFPHLALTSDLVLTGGESSEIVLNGLLLEGAALRVPALKADGSRNALRRLVLRHCTVIPAAGAAALVVAGLDLEVVAEKCILGPARVMEEASARFTDCLLDAGSQTAMAYAALNGSDFGGPLTVEACTLVGRVRTRELTLASNSIFYARGQANTDAVAAERLQQGCVRFCYVPPFSRVPRRHRCQPAADNQDPVMRPVFRSLKYGDPGYGQLDRRTNIAIRQGAADESEMGAFHHLFQPQRETNLRTRLDEYLRFGLTAKIFYAS